jgi:ribosomal protein L11 methylase PrmA
VAANLTGGLVRAVAGALPSLVRRRGGALIVSGLLADEEGGVKDALEAAGFTVKSAETKGEWLKLCADFS